MITELKYDIPVEIPIGKVNEIRKECSGLIAGPNLIDGKWYIKLWLPKYKKFVLEILNR